MQDNPTVSTAPPGKRITIITVVWNGADLLPGTIESVRRQTWPFIEYILIDGASKDASLEVIRLFEAEMPNLRWLSEPDQGLYDAMNKGLRMATGDFVWFLNAGDHLFDPSTVEKVAEHITEKTDVLYGDTMLVNEKRIPVGLMSALSTRSLPRRLTKKDYLGGMRVVHQSFVARHSLCPPIAWTICVPIMIGVSTSSKKAARTFIPDWFCPVTSWAVFLKSATASPSGIVLQ